MEASPFVATVTVLVSALLVSRVVAEGCALYCTKDAHPICAHSPTQGYRDFPDKCALEQINHCGREDWTLIHPGACIPTEIGGCPSQFGFVCGRSPSHGYKSFLNKCYLDVEAQLSDYSFSHDGACTPTEVPPSVCPGVCTQEYNPVCGYSPGSGYKTFSNNCFLGIENRCFFGRYSVKHTGACTDPELAFNCQRGCPKDYQPVCGRSTEKGYKSFSNLCSFYTENGCPQYDSDYKLVHDGACTTNEIASFCQPSFCPETSNPVCASSLPYYRTFRNKCLFYVENSCKYGDFQLVHNRECTETEQQQSCNAFCSQDVVPVCGFSNVRGYKTFPNRCLVNYENACFGSDYGAVHLKECKKSELELICSQEYCQKYQGRKVCGLSHTKGYTSFANECFLYAQNTCKNGDYKFAHTEECTKEERDLLCLPQFCLRPGTPVCGYSDKQGYYSFSNQCFLNQENICKQQRFTLKHDGKCTDPEIKGKCPLTCSQERQYLCALSPTLGYKTFYNKCTLEAENGCNGGDYAFNHPEECTKSELERNCQLQCTYEYNPVCAYSPTKGYNTFSNKCFYIFDISCYGSDYKFEYGGVCNVNEVTTPSPQCQSGEAVCPSGYSPVCAYSKSYKTFKTFPTKCFFDNDNKCKYDYDLIFAHYGACSADELNKNCDRSCAAEVSPVCALSPTFGYKNVRNICQLLLGLSCQRSDFRLAHEGKCTSQEAPVCTTFCPRILSPVCGFSTSQKVFTTFNNKCLWELENQCNYGDYVMAHDGPCTADEKENNCRRACATIYSPVCGYSDKKGYKTFQNKCSFILNLSCFNGDYVFSNEGKCKYPEGPQRDCPTICPQNESPVCAFSSSTKSFKTFPNQCFLTADNRCNYGDYVFAHSGRCTNDETGKKCYRKCPLVYKPVCGLQVTFGYRTFPSLCDLEVANKCDGADYSLAHARKCTTQELGGYCRHNCPMYYIGVCGYSEVKGYKTFANECFLDRENTCTLSDYTVAHAGKCTPKETGKNCNRVCQLVYSPICGKSTSKGYKTFANFCLMDRENSCFSQDFNVAHQGECFPWELCVNCQN